MTKIKAIIFDLDGVLINAKEWHYEALNRALALFGMNINRYDHIFTYDGLPTRKKLEMLTIEYSLPRSLHDFINKLKQQNLLEYIFSNCNPLFQHQYALSRLKSDGYKIAVCSNSIRKTIEITIEKAKLAEYILFYLSNEDVNLPKPDPEIYLKAIKKLKLKPRECLILEDNEYGIKSALASGAHLLKVEYIEDVNYQNIISKINEIEG